MKILDELIESLASEGPSLTDALMKTKVLLHKVGRKDLAEWVNQELNGYAQEAVLPDYRVLHANVVGNAANIGMSVTNHPLPTRQLKPETRRRLEQLEMRESIAGVERLARGAAGKVYRLLPPESYALFSKGLSPGTHVSRAWCEIGDGAIVNILTQVRSRLLDFLLDLQGKVGDEMTEEEVKKVAQLPETGASFTQSIYGNNNTILVGSHNTQTVTQVKMGDFSSLAKELAKNGVPASDIVELEKAIQEDANSLEAPSTGGFGGSVRKWMGGMMQKAVDASWAIELGVAGNLLTDALKQFYGQ